MAHTRPGGPYIWATALAKLLTGEISCEWDGWFKAHHQGWIKPPSDFDSATWMLEHTALVNRERESLKRIGYDVYTEKQNLFRLRGATATVAGKPDLIGEKHHELLICDAKTGRPSPSHQAQVRILPVRGAQGPPAVRGQRRPRPGQVPRLLRGQPRLGSEPRVHRQHGRADQETRGR